MAVVNKTKYALLGMLSTGAYSGYDIRKGIEQSISHFWHESFGQIYPILHRLVDEGLATAEAEELPGRPRRVLYTITETGREELRRWLAESVATLPVERNEFLLKLFFGSEVPLDVSLRSIEEHRQLASELLATFGAIEEMLNSQFVGAPGLPFWLATLSYGRVQAEAVARWCDETLDQLRLAHGQ